MKDIEEQARAIMDDFIEALKDVPDIEEFGVRRATMLREEAPRSGDEGFRMRMFDNAPTVENEQLKMEKKHW